jgi:hypothetical protein
MDNFIARLAGCAGSLLLMTFARNALCEQRPWADAIGIVSGACVATTTELAAGKEVFVISLNEKPPILEPNSDRRGV